MFKNGYRCWLLLSLSMLNSSTIEEVFDVLPSFNGNISVHLRLICTSLVSLRCLLQWALGALGEE